jgi:hypothetical protein
MLRNKAVSCLIVLSALVSPACAAGMPAPAPSFTISASNVTMPESGMVAIPITFTSVNGFAGSVAVSCNPPTVAAGVRAPFCQGGGPVMAYPLSANGTATGNVGIVAIPLNVEAAAIASSAKHRQEGSWALAGVLMLGIGLRRLSRRVARAMLAIVGMGVIATGLSGCGGPPTLTPGSYVFTLNANSVDTTTPLTASATATVTVPAGIVTKSNN